MTLEIRYTTYILQRYIDIYRYPKALWLLTFTLSSFLDKSKADIHLRIMESIYQIHILQVFTLFDSWVDKLKYDD